jgi:hypothetical protein
MQTPKIKIVTVYCALKHVSKAAFQQNPSESKEEGSTEKEKGNNINEEGGTR